MEKNPVMILQELGVRGGKTPVFQVEEIRSVPPVFKTLCKFTFLGKEYQVMDESLTKKSGKTNASKKMLDEYITPRLKMDDPDIRRIFGLKDQPASPPRPLPVDDFETPVSSPGPSPMKVRRDSGNDEMEVDEVSNYARTGNPIADLSDDCLRLKIEEPVYTNGPRSGPSHKPTLSVYCELKEFGLKVCGVQMQSKLCKRVAAEKMRIALKEQERISGGKLEAVPSGSATVPDKEVGPPKVTIPKSPKKVEDRVAGVLKYLKLANPGSEMFDETWTGELPQQREYDDAGYFFEMEDDRAKEFNKMRMEASAETTPRLKELVDFSIQLNRKYPAQFKPMEKYAEWLQNHPLGVDGFYKQLKDEIILREDEVVRLTPANNNNENEEDTFYDALMMRSDSDTSDSDDEERYQYEMPPDMLALEKVPLGRYMVGLSIKVRGIKFKHPTSVQFDDDEGKARRAVRTELIMYLGLMLAGVGA